MAGRQAFTRSKSRAPHFRGRAIGPVHPSPEGCAACALLSSLRVPNHRFMEIPVMRSILSVARPLSLIAVAAFAVACGSAAIEVEGEWESEFGGKTTITSEKWGVSSVVNYDNDANWAVIQMPADDAFNPEKFAKIVWTEIDNNSFYECWVAFGQETAKDAENTTEKADSTNPAESGCAGYSWTKNTAVSSGS